VALSQVGVREHGFNRGKQVELYQRAGGGKPGDAWCSWFVSWCLRQAHAGTSYFGRARSWFDARHTIWTNGHPVPGCPAPQPGDLLGYTWGNPAIAHVELLLDWTTTPSCKAIGGNTGGGRALLREGDGVFINWRLKRLVKSVANPIDNPKY
jgi:hypothetical protein